MQDRAYNAASRTGPSRPAGSTHRKHTLFEEEHVMAAPYPTRSCGACKIAFRPMNSCQRFCSKKCNHAFHRDDIIRVSSGTMGAISELVVSSHLMKMGYHVFRALSPSCPCDIIAMKGDQIRRIEVRTGRRSIDGRIYFGRVRKPEMTEYGIYIVKTNEVVFIALDGSTLQ